MSQTGTKRFGWLLLSSSSLHGSRSGRSFGAEGPNIVTRLKSEGAKVFLDLKFHDIPNTVEAAARGCSVLGVDMFNVHALGGREMMKAAVDAARSTNGGKTKVLGVTLLTSMDQEALITELRVTTWVRAYVAHLARIALDAGLDGVVASPRELSRLRFDLGETPFIVTPGIRPRGVDKADQKRTETPEMAIRQQADVLVIGRAIVAQEDPALAAREITEAIKLEIEANGQ